MTFEELLKAQGLTDEKIKAIADSMKEQKIYTASAENLDIRYSKLKGDFDNLTAQHTESTKLIESLQKGNKDNQTLQSQVAGYQKQVDQLQNQLNDQKVESAMDRVLTKAGAKAADLDYLKFRWRKNGEITLDEGGEIKGVNDTVSALRTQCPGQFEKNVSKLKIEPQKLPEGDQSPAQPKNLAEAIQQSYENTGK